MKLANFYRITLVFIFSVIISLTSVIHANAAKRLSASVADWTGGMVTCQVAVAVLEQELGYKVKRINIPSGTGLYEAIAAGDVDFACESWPSYTDMDTVMVEHFGGDGSVLWLGDTGIVGASDYYVPKYFVDANPDFKSWKDLNKYKDQFSTIETGDKGRLIGCPVPGWNCYDQKRLDMLGIDFIADELGTETASWAEAQAAFARKEPFLLYSWEPHWIHAAMDLVGVKLPPNAPCETWNEADNYKDCGLGKWPATGWAEDITFNYGNPDVFKDHPEAAHMFSKFSISNKDQAKMIYAIDKDGRDIAEVVQEWKDANKDIWSAWLP